jgi:anion-transporting  ArsA/GET3 family ATPase
MTALPSLRFLFVTGKGGVGKTVLTAALARWLSTQNKRVLLAITGGEQRFQALLGGRRIDETIREIAPGVSAVLLRSEVAVREYGAMVLKSQKLSNALFDNKYVQGFFNGAPGLKEWALLGKAWFHATETLPSGAPRFDTVLFDAPATGHGLEMLRVPKVIVDVSPPGVLRNDAERAWTFFRDPAQSGVIVVTLPEEMPTNETFELVQALRAELRLPIAALAVNGLVEPIFAASARASLEAISGEALDEADPAESVIASARRRALRERVQSESLTRLGELGLREIRLPLIAGGVESPAALSALIGAFETAPADLAPRARRT